MQKQNNNSAVPSRTASPRSPLILSPTTSTASSASTAQRLNELLCSFPQWNDPVLVQSLFAPLPSRASKPEAFAQKFTFWHDVLLAALRQRLLAGGSAFCLNETRGLGQKYFRNNGVGGLYPICLTGVLKEMIRQGSAVVSIEDDVRRGSWFGRFLSLFTSTTGAEDEDSEGDGDDLNKDAASDLPQSLIFLPLLTEQLDLLKEHFASNPNTLPFTLAQFKTLVNSCRLREGLAEISSAEDLTLLLKFLSKRGFLHYSVADDVVKLASRGPITQMDRDVVKIRGVAERLGSQIGQYNETASELRASAARRAAQGDRSGALLELRRVAALDTGARDRMAKLSNLDALMLKIEGAQDDVAVMDAYRSGSTLLGGLLKELEGAEGVMDDLALLLGEARDKATVISTVQDASDLDELESELAKLVVHEPTATTSTVETTASNVEPIPEPIAQSVAEPVAVDAEESQEEIRHLEAA